LAVVELALLIHPHQVAVVIPYLVQSHQSVAVLEAIMTKQPSLVGLEVAKQRVMVKD
jgi:hypothetical protein